MKIVIFGANGKTGSLMVEQALELGHQVTAYVRRPGAILQQHPNLKIIIGGLNDSSRLSEAIKGADACFSTLGGASLTKHASEVATGIENIIKTMELTGVSRFIYLSSIGTGESRYYMGPIMRFFIVDLMLRIPMADHTVNERRLTASKLQWTVVKPGSLTDGPKTGNLKHGSEKIMLKGSPKISRANVAAFMLAQLNDSTYVKNAAWLYE
jgi:putative NADH-flavin reductase